MGDERVEDEMIEIGDPSEEMTAVEPPPRLVIEYRERGVPWMLIPPMIVLSAVGAVLLYTKLTAAPAHPSASIAVSRTAEAPAESARWGRRQPRSPSPGRRWPPRSRPDAGPGPRRGRGLSSRFDVPPARPAEPSRPSRRRSPSPLPHPQVQGARIRPQGARGRSEGRGPGRPGPGDRPSPATDRPDDRERLPREIDPDLLPPDPLEARRRQQQRKVELALKVEDERSRFHAELKAICRKFREDSGPEIREMIKRIRRQRRPEGPEDGGRVAGQERQVRRGGSAGPRRTPPVPRLPRTRHPRRHLQPRDEANQRTRRAQRSREAYYFTALFLLRNPPPDVDFPYQARLEPRQRRPSPAR